MKSLSISSRVATQMIALIFTLISVSASAQVTSAQSYAVFMYQRLAGITLQPTDARITAMVGLINQGNLLGAAQYVIANDHNVFNITIREIAAQQPTRLGVLLPNAPTTDYIADWIGTAYNGGQPTSADARQLVTGNFYYAASAAAVAQYSIPDNLQKDIVTSNNHYAFMDANGLDYAAILVNAGPQQLLNAAATGTVNNPDAAGAITSLGFFTGCGNAGTNRACVRDAIWEFEGVDIATYADTGPDGMVGADVDRDPPYQTSCQNCHNRLDSMRPAFALFDMDPSGSFIENALYNPKPCTIAQSKYDCTGNGQNNCSGQFAPDNVAVKELRNCQVFPQGFAVTTPAWTNTAATGIYQTMFGWGSNTSGAGAGQFGQMLAGATAFGTNMATRIFTQVCERTPAADETGTISALGANFQGAWKYDIKMLMAQVAILPDCLGSPN